MRVCDKTETLLNQLADIFLYGMQENINNELLFFTLVKEN